MENTANNCGQNSSTVTVKKIRGSKSVLYCKSGEAPERKKHAGISKTYTLEISDSYRKLSFALDSNEANELIGNCKEVMEKCEIEYDKTYEFLTRYMSGKQAAACSMVHNIMGCNSVSTLEYYYDGLAKILRGHEELLSEYSEDGIEDVDDVRTAYRFMRQAYYLMTDLHKCTEPLWIWEGTSVDHVNMDINGMRASMHFHLLTLTYRPYRNEDTKMNCPWKMKIDEKFWGPKDGFIPLANNRTSKSIDISLCTKDFSKFLSWIAEEKVNPEE